MTRFDFNVFKRLDMCDPSYKNFGALLMLLNGKSKRSDGDPVEVDHEFVKALNLFHIVPDIKSHVHHLQFRVQDMAKFKEQMVSLKKKARLDLFTHAVAEYAVAYQKLQAFDRPRSVSKSKVQRPETSIEERLRQAENQAISLREHSPQSRNFGAARSMTGGMPAVKGAANEQDDKVSAFSTV